MTKLIQEIKQFMKDNGDWELVKVDPQPHGYFDLTFHCVPTLVAEDGTRALRKDMTLELTYSNVPDISLESVLKMTFQFPTTKHWYGATQGRFRDTITEFKIENGKWIR